MRTRTHPAPEATVEPIRATRKALAALVDEDRLEDARPLARFILSEVAALDREGYTRPVRATDLELCERILTGRQRPRSIPLSPVAPV
jgi:primosomal protein N''